MAIMGTQKSHRLFALLGCLSSAVILSLFGRLPQIVDEATAPQIVGKGTATRQTLWGREVVATLESRGVREVVLSQGRSECLNPSEILHNAATLLQCAEQTAAFQGQCGSHFMWSSTYAATWGCRCCGTEKLRSAPNEHWDLYSVDFKKAAAAFQTHASSEEMLRAFRGAERFVATNKLSRRAYSSISEDHPVLLFPLPKQLQVEGCCVRLDPMVRISTVVGSPGATSGVLHRAVARAQAALREAAGRPRNLKVSGGTLLQPIQQVRVVAQSSSEQLDVSTDVAYNLSCAANTCTISAPGVFGAVTALDSTLVQLFAGGTARFQSLQLEDSPDFQVRGLMVDSGRRFVPLGVLKRDIVQGMALFKLNFLQLHLSDFCRFALALPQFPQLNRSGLFAGAYSLADIRELVDFARDRGIRVMPEVDVPGHARGLLPLKAYGLQFCEPPPNEPAIHPVYAEKIYDDPQGRSRSVLRALLEETAKAFAPEQWLHMGFDEAVPIQHCTQENLVQLEAYLVNDVASETLGRTAVGWEELLMKTPEEAGRRSVGRATDAILVAWNQGTPKGIASRGHRVLDARAMHHYLDLKIPVTQFWHNPLDHGDRDSSPWHREKLLGGLSAMWTDQYCYIFQCGAASETWAEKNGLLPVGAVMFNRELDKSFRQSLGGMIWPRAAVAAAAKWNFQPQSEALIFRLADFVSENLLSKGIHACPAGCTCNEVDSCGVPYAAIWEDTLSEAEGDAALRNCTRVALQGELGLRLRGIGTMDLTPALRLCFWRHRDCAGLVCSTAGPSTSCMLMSPGAEAVPSNIAAKGFSIVFDSQAHPRCRIAARSWS